MEWSVFQVGHYPWKRWRIEPSEQDIFVIILVDGDPPKDVA